VTKLFVSASGATFFVADSFGFSVAILAQAILVEALLTLNRFDILL